MVYSPKFHDCVDLKFDIFVHSLCGSISAIPTCYIKSDFLTSPGVLAAVFKCQDLLVVSEKLPAIHK